MIQTTYSDLRRNLARYLDEVVDDAEEILVKRKNGRDVVLVDAAEYNSMKETLHVLTPRENAKRLLEAFDELDRGEGIEVTMEELREFVETRGEKPLRFAEVLAKRNGR